MRDATDFLAPGGALRIEGSAGGPLAGLTFVAKDLFDVAGTVTGCGNPDWARTHPPAERHAFAVSRLLDAGATLVGKTITDEISLGLLGENAFYGTPLNPRAPGRVPGGSSSGSASAVAQGAADAGLGTDTGGSVRVPASFCGLYGIRPTHGRLPLDGMAPQAPSSDTTGWFARDAATFASVSAAIFGEGEGPLPTRLVILTDAFGFAGSETEAALAPAVARLERLLGPAERAMLAPQGLSVWGRAQRTLQMAEAWATFRDWVEREVPAFSYLVARSLMAGATMPATELPWAALMRDEARARLAQLTADGAALLMPTTPGPAPLKNLPLPEMDRARDRINCLCAHGGLAGHPQVSLPLGEVGGAPVGLSLIGARGADMSLVALAAALENAA
ncbi:MAG: amidase [Pikeienuella sp.]|uniref:amidase n=1 Tax=Pikeienuella sp. TaxID=2831957 RepID=UPI00391B7623